ncbi:hypothetical protein GJAV_G00214970 [Gymnothorax javanicus]|nr:hypothetical protein GJAV_G00214970 [Gymnothorax javanicus]
MKMLGTVLRKRSADGDEPPQKTEKVAGVMESAALGSLLGGVLLVLPVVVLIGLCGGCRRTRFRKSIPEHSTDDYIEQDNNQPGFMVIRSPRAGLPVSYRSSGNSTHLFPLVSSPSNQTKKRASYIPPTADVLKVPPCNENSASQHGEYINEDSDEEDAGKGEGYIEVLPDAPVPDCGSQQRRVSTASSGGGLPTYVNPAPEDGDYVNQHSDEETEKERYIKVLADPPACDCVSQQRRVSTASSGDYVNQDSDEETEKERYIKVLADPPATDCVSQQRRVSTASSGDYVNQDSDEETEKERYIKVLADPPACDCVSQQRRVSTASSDQDNYVNMAEDDSCSDTSSQNYMNVQVDGECHTLFPGVSLENVDSDNNSSSDYVNVSEVQASPRTTRAQFSRSTTSLL